MKRTALFAAIAAVFAPGLVLADMNYTNFEVSMIDVENDSVERRRRRVRARGLVRAQRPLPLVRRMAGPEPRFRHRRPLARARRWVYPQLLGQAGLRRHPVVRRCRGEARQPDGRRRRPRDRRRHPFAHRGVGRARRLAPARRLRRVGQRHGLLGRWPLLLQRQIWPSARASTSPTTADTLRVGFRWEF